MKTMLCSLVLVFAAVLVGCSRQSAAQTCVAGPNEKCPSDLTISEFQEIKSLEAKYNPKPPTPPQEIKIRYMGLVTDFQQQKPQGFHWDEKKMRWVKDPAPGSGVVPTASPRQ